MGVWKSFLLLKGLTISLSPNIHLELTRLLKQHRFFGKIRSMRTFKMQTLIGLHGLWDQGIAAGMMDRTTEVANKNEIYYETLNMNTELTLIGLKFFFRDHFSWVGPLVRHFTIPNTESRSERLPEKWLVAYPKIWSQEVSEWPLTYNVAYKGLSSINNLVYKRFSTVLFSILSLKQKKTNITSPKLWSFTACSIWASCYRMSAHPDECEEKRWLG